MNKKIAYILIATISSILLATSSMPAFAARNLGGVAGGAESARGSDQPADLFGASGTFQTVTNVMLFLVGAVSVIMIIIGGLRYVLSNGDSSQITAAKNTILYAIIGLIVAILAFAIIRFIIGSFAVDSLGGGGGSATSF